MKNVLLVALMFFLCGCETKEEVVTDILKVSWNENATEIAFYERQYDEVQKASYPPSGIYQKNYRARIGVINTDGTDKKYLTDFFKITRFDPGPNSWEFYYRKEHAYVIFREDTTLSHLITNGSLNTHRLHIAENDITMINLEGDVIKQYSKTLDNICEDGLYVGSPLRVIPSPNGSVIAEANVSSNCEIELSFTNPNNNLTTIENYTLPGNGVGGMFWLNEDHLFINALSCQQCHHWYLVKQDAPPLLVTAENFFALCLEGAKVSSEINMHGETVEWTDLEDIPDIIPASDRYRSELFLGPASLSRLPNNPLGCMPISDLH